jgi:flagellar protein FlaG
MFDNETLSRVSEYKPGAKISRVATNQATAKPSFEATPDQPDEASQRAVHASKSEALDNAIGNLSAHVQNLQRSLHFSVDKASGDTVVRVIDMETHEVIRQIPSEEVLIIAERMRTTAGILLSEEA